MSVVLAIFFIVWVIAVVGLVLTPCSSTPRHRLQKEEMVKPAPTKPVCRVSKRTDGVIVFKCSNDGDNKKDT